MSIKDGIKTMPEDSRAGDGRAAHSWAGRNLRAFFYGGMKDGQGDTDQSRKIIYGKRDGGNPKVFQGTTIWAKGRNGCG